jgi:hypothetical protein
MTTVYSTINAPFKYSLNEEQLASFIRSNKFPEEFKGHIYAFFTEISVSEIYKFIKEQDVSLDELKNYYFKYIERTYTNAELEEMFIIE